MSKNETFMCSFMLAAAKADLILKSNHSLWGSCVEMYVASLPVIHCWMSCVSSCDHYMAVVCLLPASSEYFITEFVLLCTFLFTEIYFDSRKLLHFQVFEDCVSVCVSHYQSCISTLLFVPCCVSCQSTRKTHCDPPFTKCHLAVWKDKCFRAQPRTHIFTLKMNTYNDREQQRVYAFTLLLEADYMNILLVYRS